MSFDSKSFQYWCQPALVECQLTTEPPNAQHLHGKAQVFAVQIYIISNKIYDNINVK